MPLILFSNIASTDHISFLLVFMEGLLSFLSPCVVPLIPVYMSYLAGSAKNTNEDGLIQYNRMKVFFHTVLFVLGISFAFFILGMSFTTLGFFFKNNQTLFTRIGGIIIILLGFYQVGLLDFKFLQREHKFHLKLKDREVNPLIAFIMGFTFSFAWTPCVGPALSSVLIMASGTGSSLTGNVLVLVYTLGFIIPFLLLGLFTTQVLNFLKSHQKLLKYTVKVGGAILILIGFMTFTGWMNSLSVYLNRFTPNQSNQEEMDTQNADSSEPIDNDDINNQANDNPQNTPDTPGSNNTISSNSSSDQPSDYESDSEKQVIPAFDFTLLDQYGNEHTLSDYKGKVVFLNFWATWCPPCKKELPDIEELYKEYGENKEDVIILGVANPKSKEYPRNIDESKSDIISFLEDNNLTYPTVFDETGDVFSEYYITSYPTTFMIDKEGNFYGYVSGMMTKDIMNNVVLETLDSTE